VCGYHRRLTTSSTGNLDLFIWGDALAGAQERAKRLFMQMICGGAFEIPSVTELTATGVPFIEAV
jgi:hypothetical protein